MSDTMAVDLWQEISPGKGAPETVTAVTVTPKDSVNIYEYHHEHDLLTLERVIHSPPRPPGDLGFVPRTYTEGDGPLDVVILTSAPTPPKTLVRVRPVAVLKMTVDQARRDQVLCVPLNDDRMNHIETKEGVNPNLLDNVRQFFESSYSGGLVRVDGMKGADEARRTVKRSMGLYGRKYNL